MTSLVVHPTVYAAANSATLAERTLLEGVAMLGLDENDARGAQLVENALSVPRKLAQGLPPALAAIKRSPT